MRKKHVLIGGLSILGAVIILGCGGVLWLLQTHEYDVTGDPKYPTDYARGTVYVTQQDMFLHDGGTGSAKLYLQLCNSPSDPTVAEYRSDPKRWSSIVGLISPGTRVRFEKLLYHSGFEMSGACPMVEILDGPLAGKSADAGLVSRTVSFNDAYVIPGNMVEVPAK